MRDGWLAGMYRKIKDSRDARFSRALDLLRKKAANDPEIKEALNLLEADAQEWLKDDSGDRPLG